MKKATVGRSGTLEALGFERPAVTKVARVTLEQLGQVAGEKVFSTTPLVHAKDTFSEKQARDGILGLIFCVRQLARKDEMPPREIAEVRARLLETVEDLFSDSDIAVWQQRGYYLLIDQLLRSGKNKNIVTGCRLLRRPMSGHITVTEPTSSNPHAFVDVMLSLAEEISRSHDDAHHERVLDAAELLVQTYSGLFSLLRQELDQWCAETLGKKDKKRYRKIWQQLAQNLAFQCLYRRLAHCWLNFVHLYLSEHAYGQVPASQEHLEHAFAVVARGQ